VGSHDQTERICAYSKFPIYWVPQRVGRSLVRDSEALRFPIYWVPQRVGSGRVDYVLSWFELFPNLLGSPASGETLKIQCAAGSYRFQFIGFPSEWGVQLLLAKARGESFQFIGFPQRVGSSCLKASSYPPREFPIYWVPQRVGSRGSIVRDRPEHWGIAFPIYWVPQRVGRSSEISTLEVQGYSSSFQFIGFPSEWGVAVKPELWTPKHRERLVSNLLGSPASGEFACAGLHSFQLKLVSNLLGSPASGEFALQKTAGNPVTGQRFQFIGFPSEWGVHPIKTRMDREWQGAFASISQNRYTLYCF
jgi:hypothetical protein